MDHFDRDKAKELMCFYFQLLFEEAGIEWKVDNRSEVDELVDHLINAAKNELAETKQAQ